MKLSEWTFAIDYENVSDMCVGERGGWMVGSAWSINKKQFDAGDH